MESTDPKSLTEAQVSRKLGEIRASLPEQKLKDVFEWLIKVHKSHPKLFADVAATLGEITEQTVDVKLLEKILVFFKNNLEKCEGPCAEHFVFVSFIAHAQENDTLDNVAGEILQRVQEVASESSEPFQVMSPLLKTKIVPKLKEMAEAKSYKKSFAVWRAIIRTTKLKITTSVTNDVLQIATMAFKENNPECHALAFKSWRTLIENLPPDVLRKPAYIRLVLNPLNRSYRDTDANSTLQKYIAWWQHVVTLAEDAELNFDEVVVPLVQKVFCMPSAKARQVNPTAFANPTRTIPQCAYTILALLWFDGNPLLRQELKQLGNPNFELNQHSFKVSCLAKHCTVFEDALNLIVNNITQRVCVPPKEYPFLLCRVLLCRINTFYENNHYDMVRLILSTVYCILKTKLDFESTLKVYDYLSEHLPSRVMSSSQFNFRKGTFSMHECPVLTLTSFYIMHVSEICHATGGENNKKKFRQGLRSLLDQGSKNMNVSRLTEHVMATIQDAEALEAESWQEFSAFLKGYLERNIENGENAELGSKTIPVALAIPMRSTFPLTANVTKNWIELLTTTIKTNSRATDASLNKHAGEICSAAHGMISKCAYDLNRLLLISQMMESLLKHFDLQSSAVSPESTPTRRTRKLGSLEPFTECLIEIIRKGCDHLKYDKPKAACQFYVNVVEMVHTLLRDSKTTELCKEFVLKLVPELGPILELTADKATMRTSPLFHVESALMTAVDHVLYALKTKSNDLPKRDESVIEVIRIVMKKLANHWKASINETVQELAKTFSITPERTTPLKRSLFGSEDGQVSTPRSSARSRESVDPKPQEESQPERKWTRSTPDASALRNGSARDKSSPKLAPASKRKSKAAPEEEFVAITSTKKKSEIYTEHQLEKLKEPKIIPSMYEDLSRSSQGTLMGPPTRLPETRANASTIETNSSPTTPNGSQSSNGKYPTRESSRRFAPLTRKSSPKKLRDHSSSDDNLEVAFSGNSRETSPENEVAARNTATEDQNGENKKPKDNDSHSNSHSASTKTSNAEAAVSSQEEEESQRVPDAQSATERIAEGVEKPRGALKRKFAKPSFSPMAAKLRPKRSSSNLDKTSSKRPKPDGQRSRGMDSNSIADVETKPDPEKDAQKLKLPKKSAATETEVENSKKTRASSGVKVETRQNTAKTKTGDASEELTNDVSPSPSPDSEDVSQHSLVNRLKKAVGAQREGVLKFISSPEFLQNMTRDERRSFLSSFFKNVSDYIL